jgi:hypothetical protein
MNKLIRTSLAALVAACSIGLTAPASAQLNTRLVSNRPLGSGNGEVWAEGNYAYVARGSGGLAIIDISNPAAPVLRNTILPFAHARISDVQVIGNLAYLSNEITNGSPTPHVGMFIYDVSNPLAPVELSRLEWGMGGGYHLGCDAHSVTVDEPAPGVRVAYLSSGITGDLALFDVSNPAVPVYLSEILSPVWAYYSQAHDCVVRNGRAYVSWLGGGFTVHDVSNPTAPVQLAHVPTTGVNTEFYYHMALSGDGQTLLVTTEKASAPDPVKIFNVSSPASISQVATYTSPGGAIAHQVSILGKYAYIAHLTDGLRILDISNPALPRSVGQYDPEAGSGSAFVGGYSVFPTANNIYLSHTSGGLYTVDFVDTITITKADWLRRDNTLVIEATSTAAPSVSLNVTGRAAMTYNVSLNKYVLTQTGVTSQPATVTVTSDIGGTRSSSVRRVNN